MTSPHLYSSPEHRERVQGLDALRIAALMLVTWQHAASVLGAYAQTQWRGISPGQTGVAIFCAISGCLAFRATPRDTDQWLVRRMLGIFPAYWLVTMAAFAVALIADSGKSLSIGLFVSQMLGVGYFTHGWGLLNVVSWFISLILLCYLLSFVAWRSTHPVVFWAAVVVVAVLAASTRFEVVLSRHVISFALGALYARLTARGPWTFVAAALIGVGVLWDPQMFYPGAAILTLNLAVSGHLWEPSFVRRAAVYSYQYFLVHGMFLVAASKIVHSPLALVALAVAAAMLGALALYRLERLLLPRTQPIASFATRFLQRARGIR